MSNKQILPWENVVDQGFGDRHNICAWSTACYKNYLYVGTLNFQHGCQIYRSLTGDKTTWHQINKNGFTIDSSSSGARTMMVFHDLLWVITFSRLHGSQVWITNGEENSTDNTLIWKKANENGFGEGANQPGSRAMAIYQNNLYIGTQYRNGIPRIYRYDGSFDFNTMDPSAWTWINKSWEKTLGNIGDYFLIGKLVPFRDSNGKEFLYASVYPELAHLIGQLQRKFHPKILWKIVRFFTILRSQIWRYDGEEWEQINTNGFSGSNIMIMSSSVFQDELYVGTTNVFGGELWKTTDGTHWNRIIHRGLGNPLNISIWGIGAYKQRLILGIQNLWQGGQIWMSSHQHPTNNKDFIRISNYRMDGVKQCNILKITQDGIKQFEVFKDCLYAPTSSYMNILRSNILGPGCELWRIKDIGQ